VVKATGKATKTRNRGVLKEIPMSQARHFDVIIIGSGAGGGTLAYALAPSGKRILLLERGDYVAREKDNWNPRAVNVEGKYQTKEVWRGADGMPLHPHGLANSSGVVGRHYTGHVNSVLMAISKCPNPPMFQKSLSLNDFYFGSEEWDYPPWGTSPSSANSTP
jgi:hypothetical protein